MLVNEIERRDGMNPATLTTQPLMLCTPAYIAERDAAEMGAA
jgi:hypothetical protein